MAEARGLPPPQVARSSSSSIRARQTIRTGTSRSDRARCSITSSMRSSAHWTSSNTSTSGCASASCSAQRRAAQLVSVDASASSAAPRTPSATPRRSATASLSQHIRSFSNASAAGSSSVIPAEALTIEAIGQNAIPSPYGRARPVSTVARSTPAVNSSTSLDFPTPGSPKTVTSVVRRSRTVRSYELWSSSSSCSRPTKRAFGRRLRMSSTRTTRQDQVCSPGRISTAPASSTSIAPTVRRRATGPRAMVPAMADCCRRAATFTASPVANVESTSSTTSSPDSIPTRASSPSSCTDSSTSNAARTARSASSSCAWGTPKAAMTASPANFSTVPP